MHEQLQVLRQPIPFGGVRFQHSRLCLVLRLSSFANENNNRVCWHLAARPLSLAKGIFPFSVSLR